MCILISLNSDTVQQLWTFISTSYKIRRFEILHSCFRYCDHRNELRISKEKKKICVLHSDRFTQTREYEEFQLNVILCLTYSYNIHI